VKRLLQRSNIWHRAVAALIVFAWLATAAGMFAGPVQAGATSVAVVQFQNDAGAPQSVVNTLSQALYNSVANSPNYTAKGGGPLPATQSQLGSYLTSALSAAAHAGADHVLIGDVVAYGGGSVTFRIEAYRVAPLTPIRSQVFTQTYPTDNQALAAAMSSDVNALEAPRAGTGTIFDIRNGKIEADLGTAEGFSIGERFNVIRNGQKVAEAQITTIYPDFADVEISNASQGYAPAVGDRLVSQESKPAAAIAPPQASAGAFNPIGWILGAAAVLLAIGHGGSANIIAQPSPSPTTSPGGFSVMQSSSTAGANPTIVFTFSAPVSSTDCVSIPNDQSRATETETVGGVTKPMTPLANLGSATFDAGCTNLTIMVTNPTYTLFSTGDKIVFTFTSVIVSNVGTPLITAPITFTRTSSVARRPLATAPAHPATAPQRPGGGPPQTGGQKPPTMPTKPNPGGSGVIPH